MGDVHAMMGDGEVAGHTTDVSAEVIIEVNVIKGLTIDGPIVLPGARICPRWPALIRTRKRVRRLGFARITVSRSNQLCSGEERFRCGSEYRCSQWINENGSADGVFYCGSQESRYDYRRYSNWEVAGGCGSNHVDAGKHS